MVVFSGFCGNGNEYRENLESQSMLVLLPQVKDRTQQIASDFIKLRVEAPRLPFASFSLNYPQVVSY